MRCQACGFDSPTGFRFCGGCGGALPVSIPPAEEAAERRQLTVLFCDLVGSTALSERLDPEELRDLVRSYQEACADAIARFDGHVAQYLGDGILAYFGYPRAHEDDARRGVLAGLALIEAIETLGPDLERRYGAPVALRVGIHTGLVVTGQVGGGDRSEHLALGQAPNVAARLQALAEPNTVVVSDRLEQLARGLFVYELLGTRELKGVSEPLQIYRVLGESGARDRFHASARQGLAPMVGRGAELEQLVTLGAEARRGAPQAVLIRGEPGIGKSRLLEAFERTLPEDEVESWLLGCSGYHRGTALFPVVTALRKAVDRATGDDPRSRLEAFLEAEPERRDDEVALLEELLSVATPGAAAGRDSPQRRRARLLELFCTLVERRTRRRPLLIVVEDVHWIDPSTRELLEQLLARPAPDPAAGRRLIVLTARPELDDAWAERHGVPTLELGRLGNDDALAVVHRVMGEVADAELAARILDRAGGVPFYLEELAKVAAGKDAPDGLPIPSTLQDSLAARLDAVGTAKEVAQVAAVVGRRFGRGMLAALLEMDAETLDTHLQRLQDAELVTRSEDDEAGFVFKHALLRDAAYESLLRRTREAKHRSAAETLVGDFGEAAEREPELVARHFSEGGVPEQAVAWWIKAGQRALARFDNQEGQQHLSAGIAELSGLPEGPGRDRHELTLRLCLGSASIALNGYSHPSVGEAYARARELCERLALPDRERFLPNVGLWTFHVVRSELTAAWPLAERLLALSASSGDPAQAVTAHFAAGFTAFFQGRLERALEHLTRAASDGEAHDLSAVSPTGDDHEVHARVFMAWTLHNMGRWEEATQHADGAIELAERRGHPYGIVYAKSVAATVHYLCGNLERSEALAQASIAASMEQGYSYLMGTSIFSLGTALASRAEDGEEGSAALAGQGLEHMRSMLARFRAVDAHLMGTYMVSRLLDHTLRLGQPLPADEVEAVERTIERTGERCWQSECLRLRAQHALRASGADTDGHAERLLRSAIELARKQGAGTFELRAIRALSELLAHTDRPAEAREGLGEVLERVVLPDAAADVRAARGLLQALS